MTERERLIQLLNHKDLHREGVYLEDVADFLLEHNVIVPPVKAGSTVYCLIGNKVKERKIETLTIGNDGYMSMNFGTTVFANINQIGKTVFLTKEEAEKALKEREK